MQVRMRWQGGLVYCSARSAHSRAPPADFPEVAGAVREAPDEPLSPAPEAWHRFWARGWGRLVVGAGVSGPYKVTLDGYAWWLRLEHAGRSVEAEGYNAYPEGFEEYLQAVGELVARPLWPKGGPRPHR